jgi:hypothetical protein
MSPGTDRRMKHARAALERSGSRRSPQGRRGGAHAGSQ